MHGRDASGECLEPLYDSPCGSLTGDLECQCVDSAPGQFSCGYFCETRDCP